METDNYLDHQPADSKLKPIMRFLLKIPKAYAGKSYNYEKDLRTIVEEREQRRPPARRVVPYTEVLTYML